MLKKPNKTSDILKDGPQKEIYEWKKLLRKKETNNKTVSLDELENYIKKRIKPDYPPAWKEQPLYQNEIIQRIIRCALMHFNLSHNKHSIKNYFKEIYDLSDFIINKFPGFKEVKAFEAKIGKKKVIFIGKIYNNLSIRVYGLYLGHNLKKLRPVKNLHELFKTLCLKEHKDSIEIVTKEVLSYYDFTDFVEKKMSKNISSWLRTKKISKVTSFAQLVEKTFLNFTKRDAVFELNSFLEGTMLARHSGQHAYINELEKEYWAASLKPIKLFRIKIPLEKVTHITLGQQNNVLIEKDKAILYVHPTTVDILKRIKPEIISQQEEVLFYPTVGSRSGYIKINGQWQDYQVKFDIFRILSGWYRLCGFNTANEEIEVTSFFQRHRNKNRLIPDSLFLMPTTEGVVHSIQENVNIATLARTIPDNLKDKVLIPAAYLYSKGIFSFHSLLDELINGKDPESIDNFFEHVLIDPIMKTWDYFLSLEDKTTGEWGLAFEMHGANFYYLYNRDKFSLEPRIVTKDFASNRILSNKADKLESSQEWLIHEYDYSLGHLHLIPLIEEISFLTNRPENHYVDIVRNSFTKNVSVKNKIKFLINGKVLSSHEDVYNQLEYFFSPREKTWVSSPMFRPDNRKDYFT